ncbi:MAG: PAS domain S-box protein [Ramlibacter sp.]|nr:PAS domain S-box protein [Ramlibacter sp.]
MPAATPTLSPVSAAEAALEGGFQLLIDGVVDYGIFVLDPTGHVISWNSGAEKLKGYRRDEIIGKHFSIFYPPEANATAWPQEELRRARELGRFEDEGWRVRKDGSLFWANVIITAVQGSDGTLTGYVKITRDLTERRRHEEELRASEERFRLLVESVRDYAIFMLDPDGIIRSWNAGAQTLKGYAAGEIIGRHFSSFYTPQDQQAGKPAAELRTARANGRVEDEGWRVRKDGTLFWANVVITAVYGRTGELLGYAKVTRDMTQRRRLEELERSSRMMNEFLAMLAHELRNPLAPMRNAVTVMQLEPIASAALRDCRDIIDRQLSHVTRLVDDLLDVGRFATGKIKLRRQLQRVDEVVARSVETVRPTLQARGHAFEIDQPPTPVHVNGDPTRLSQVLQNLLLNAAKFTPDGGRIALKVATEGGFVAISVTDNGRGIDAADLERVFGLFVQGDNGTPNESGLGIGLTLARSLTEMHGGRLDAESPGRGMGTTFTVRLPLVNMRSGGGDGQRDEHGPSTGRRVLVVDDNRDAADSTITILRLLGHQAECAYNGHEAVETARRFPADVVLLDLAMPGLDGFETLKLLRALPGLESVFAIAMTGYGSGDDRRRTMAAGFDAHLTKPVELGALVALLNEVRPAA